jgi:glyoxylase-like metal-dependent hydrolase (beta-lactamase superfamily II)/8-oxo-dGTP pyrophosphatase MutT (NUDIX family)
MSELPAGVAPARPPEPRDSASAVLLRGKPGEWEVLLGTRSRRASFMPGHLAFPGGVVDPEDGDGAGRFARCASRELAEETGLEVGVEDWTEAGERVTPPLFPLRFRTRFFVAGYPDGAPPPGPATEEIEELAFRPATVALAEWTSGRIRIPPPVLPLLRTLVEAAELEVPQIAERLGRANAVEQRAPRIEFLPDVWMLPVRTATLPPATHTNVWMPGGRRFVVVDPGSRETDEQQRLVEVIERRRMLGHEPRVLLLTHHHRDHTGRAAELAGRLRLPLLAHPRVLEQLGGAAADLGVEALVDGDEMDLDGMTLRALLTPGHAEGHLAFELPERSALIAGDLLSGISTILIDPEHGDMAAYLASLERARSLGCDLLLPGHGPPLPGRALDELIEHRRDRERRVIEAVEVAGPELAGIARRTYAEEPGLPQPLIELQTLAHLIDLERRGLARREEPQGRRWLPGAAASEES